jgi:hypothetical protein
MRRRQQIALVGVGALLFLLVSILLARIFGANGAEQSAITSLVKAEAAGDRAAMVGRIEGCSRSAACLARVGEDAATLTRPGSVTIIQLQPSTSFAIGGKVGTARVVWSAGSSLPIVQCVKVRRAGNLVSGLRVQLLELSRRIKTDSACPPRY